MRIDGICLLTYCMTLIVYGWTVCEMQCKARRLSGSRGSALGSRQQRETQIFFLYFIYQYRNIYIYICNYICVVYFRGIT
jgi:hypothetical protein